MNSKTAIKCRRCGKCCFADMIAYVTDEEITQWKDQGREDILHIISNEKAFWAGDHLVSARDGRALKGCPFLKWEGDHCSCSIYEARPRVCRDYEPGSSQICPMWKPPDQSWDFRTQSSGG